MPDPCERLGLKVLRVRTLDLPPAFAYSVNTMEAGPSATAHCSGNADALYMAARLGQFTAFLWQ
jgi:hypothetical protein